MEENVRISIKVLLGNSMYLGEVQSTINSNYDMILRGRNEIACLCHHDPKVFVALQKKNFPNGTFIDEPEVRSSSAKITNSLVTPSRNPLDYTIDQG